MVSVGTIISLAIVGGIVAGGYALYRNADKIGGALSRGTETFLTNPIGNYFENLWTDVKTATGTAPGQAGQGINPLTIFDPLPPAGATPTPVPKVNDPSRPPGFDNPPPTNIPGQTPIVKPTGGSTPKPTPKPIAAPKGGFYYVNYTGSKYDTQWFLTPEQAAAAKKTAAAPGDAFLGIRYLGQSKLGAAGFQAFGKSQNYL